MKTKFPKLIKLAVALALVAGLAPIMATPALACTYPEIYFYPPSGPVGTEVTVYYWSGMGDLFWSWQSEHLGLDANSTFFGDIPVSHPAVLMAAGEFTIIVPDVPPGEYEIVCYDPYGWRSMLQNSAEPAIFTVTESPVKHNPSTVVGHILAMLDGKYERVWGFDVATQTWQVYDVHAQSINDLKNLERWQTIWIKTTEDDVVLNWRGTLYFLGKGWNLITALGDTYGIGKVITVPSPGNPDDT